jgi:hypothetical protein
MRYGFIFLLLPLAFRQRHGIIESKGGDDSQQLTENCMLSGNRGEMKS